jgi:hypothetical protein
MGKFHFPVDRASECAGIERKAFMSGPCFVCGKPRERIGPLCDSCKEQRHNREQEFVSGKAAISSDVQKSRPLPSEQLIELAAKMKR